MAVVGRAYRRPYVVLEGPIRVGRDDGSTTLVPPSLQPLTALLCLAPESAASRQSVLTMLWPDVPDNKARARLSTALWRLRTLLSDDGAEPDDLLQQPLPCPEAADWALLRTIDLHAIDWTDPATTELRRRLEQVALRNPQDLAQGCDHEWLVDHRAQLEIASQRALAHLVDVNAELDLVDRAIVLAEVLTDRDDLREDGHRWLMRLYARSGRRVDALRRFERCRQILDTELGVSPMEETVELADVIRSGRQLQSSAAPMTATAAAPNPAASYDPDLGFALSLGTETATILDALDRARRALAEVEAALGLHDEAAARTSPQSVTG